MQVWLKEAFGLAKSFWISESLVTMLLWVIRLKKKYKTLLILIFGGFTTLDLVKRVWIFNKIQVA